jgi:hypothetical protein
MRAYFEKIERCEHRGDERALSRIGANPSRHGWSGWLQTETATPEVNFKDGDLRKTIVESAKAVLSSPDVAITDGDRRACLDSALDPNDWRVVSDDAIGLRYAAHDPQPLSGRHSRRLLDVAERLPGRLRIVLNALRPNCCSTTRPRDRCRNASMPPATGPITSKRRQAARTPGVRGPRGHPRRRRNTPQLLMLSGIGPAAALDGSAFP